MGNAEYMGDNTFLIYIFNIYYLINNYYITLKASYLLHHV